MNISHIEDAAKETLNCIEIVATEGRTIQVDDMYSFSTPGDKSEVVLDYKFTKDRADIAPHARKMAEMSDKEIE